jgi:hypothetical protein
MTQSLFDKTIACSQAIGNAFKQSGDLISGTTTGAYITDFEYQSNKYRRAHISTIDARETKKLYLLHCTIFPHFNDPSPIFGFDVVCGPTKVSGAFLDYSKSGDSNSFMYLWFKSQVANLEWNKPRELPEWAKNIFSPSMVAIGAVNDKELGEFIALGVDALNFYIDNIGKDQQSGMDYHMAQNRYCRYQKQNPQTPRALQHLGLSEIEAKTYISNMLFPEINY